MTYLLYIDTVTCTTEYQARSHSLCEPSRLIGYLFLIFAREIDKVVEFGANQKGYCGLVESSSLSIPFLDRVECTFPRKIEHE